MSGEIGRGSCSVVLAFDEVIMELQIMHIRLDFGSLGSHSLLAPTPPPKDRGVDGDKWRIVWRLSCFVLIRSHMHL